MKFIAPSDRQKTITAHAQPITKEVLISSGKVPHLTQFAISSLTAGQEVEAHVHYDMYEVFFVVNGTGLLRVDGINHQVFAGVVFVIEPGESHEISNLGTEDLVLQYFGVVR